MRVPDEVRKCVAFVYYQHHAGERPAGTVFFVGIPIAGTDRLWTYAVTAKHVLVGIQQKSVNQKMYFRLNIKNSPARFTEIPTTNWLYHPDDPMVDAVALRVHLSSDVVDILHIHIDMSATEEVISREGIGVGDEVFITGLFVNHRGQQRNIPIVRIGNIATMPDEKVQTRNGPADAYLIEYRSIRGLSGSPVFVHSGLVRQVNGQIQFYQGVSAGGPLFLLGLVQGHWDLPEADTDTVIEDEFNNERVNTGIAIVVPITKILEIINQPEEVELRRRAEDELRLRDAPVEDSAISREGITPEQFDAALRKVSRRRPGLASSETSPADHPDDSSGTHTR
jgi:hypothetical protein